MEFVALSASKPARLAFRQYVTDALFKEVIHLLACLQEVQHEGCLPGWTVLPLHVIQSEGHPGS